MATQLTEQDARQSLNGHAAAKGAEIFQKYGPQIGWKELLKIVADPECTRYPCNVVFDPAPLGPGEFAHPVAKGETPEAGYTIHVHPCFMTQLQFVPHLVLYQLVLVNYGEFASPDDAESFGAAAVGLGKEEYYEMLCALADQLGGMEG